MRRTLDEIYALFPRVLERRAQLAGSLSGGEQQMVAIGRAMMANPRLLMLDEPSLGIAPKIVAEIASAIERINRDKDLPSSWWSRTRGWRCACRTRPMRWSTARSCVRGRRRVAGRPFRAESLSWSVNDDASPAVPPQYEAYALRYARMPRQQARQFLGGDPHDGPMPMDLSLLRAPGHVVLVDTGFGAATAASRKRELLRCPIEFLSRLGVSASDVDDVVLTHLHHDHAGNLELPRARFHVQDGEMDYATGRCMCHARCGTPMKSRTW